MASPKHPFAEGKGLKVDFILLKNSTDVTLTEFQADVLTFHLTDDKKSESQVDLRNTDFSGYRFYLSGSPFPDFTKIIHEAGSANGGGGSMEKKNTYGFRTASPSDICDILGTKIPWTEVLLDLSVANCRINCDNGRGKSSTVTELMFNLYPTNVCLFAGFTEPVHVSQRCTETEKKGSWEQYIGNQVLSVPMDNLMNVTIKSRQLVQMKKLSLQLFDAKDKKWVDAPGALERIDQLESRTDPDRGDTGVLVYQVEHDSMSWIPTLKSAPQASFNGMQGVETDEATAMEAWNLYIDLSTGMISLHTDGVSDYRFFRTTRFRFAIVSDPVSTFELKVPNELLQPLVAVLEKDDKNKADRLIRDRDDKESGAMQLLMLADPHAEDTESEVEEIVIEKPKEKKTKTKAKAKEKKPPTESKEEKKKETKKTKKPSKPPTESKEEKKKKTKKRKEASNESKEEKKKKKKTKKTEKQTDSDALLEGQVDAYTDLFFTLTNEARKKVNAAEDKYARGSKNIEVARELAEANDELTRIDEQVSSEHKELLSRWHDESKELIKLPNNEDSMETILKSVKNMQFPLPAKLAIECDFCSQPTPCKYVGLCIWCDDFDIGAVHCHKLQSPSTLCVSPNMPYQLEWEMFVDRKSGGKIEQSLKRYFDQRLGFPDDHWIFNDIRELATNFVFYEHERPGETSHFTPVPVKLMGLCTATMHATVGKTKRFKTGRNSGGVLCTTMYCSECFGCHHVTVHKDDTKKKNAPTSYSRPGFVLNQLQKSIDDETFKGFNAYNERRFWIARSKLTGKEYSETEAICYLSE